MDWHEEGDWVDLGGEEEGIRDAWNEWLIRVVQWLLEEPKWMNRLASSFTK
jgi:hypothetical protein